MFYLSKSQGKSGEDNSTFVYKALHFACLPNTHRLGIQAALFIRPRFSLHLQRYSKLSRHALRASRLKMALSPYVSRVELWLANASFRPSFRLPDEFHPSIFIKWFPGSMAKGESLIILYFLQNLHISHITYAKLFFLCLVLERIP